MRFRKAALSDISGIIKIIRQAQAELKSMDIDQWQNNYPNEETILNDIKNFNSYVLLKDDAIIATTAVIFDGESTYNRIYEGQWLSNESYAAIHRIAVTTELKGTGIASVMLHNAEVLCREKNVHSIKVDTHEANRPMQRLLEKNGFKYCGIIYLEDSSKRLAYEKVLLKCPR